MNPGYMMPSRNASLEHIEEEPGMDEIEAPLSSLASSSSTSSSSTDARTHGTGRSIRRHHSHRHAASNSLSSRIFSYEDVEGTGQSTADQAGNTANAAPFAPPLVIDEWEYNRLDINMPPNFTMADVDLSPTNLLNTRMRDLLTDSKYWIKLVGRLGYDKKVYDTETMPTLDMLSRYYDSSDMGLLRVFHLFDKDRDRLMSREEVEKGLEQQGLLANADKEMAIEALEELLALVATPATEEDIGQNLYVSPLEFLISLKCLRLAAILHPFTLLSESRRNIVASREMDIHFHEYREDTIHISRPLNDPIEFLFRVDEMPSDESRVQWIHCHEPSRRTVLALSVQLGLDPRYVLDVFTLWREQAKGDRIKNLHDVLFRENRKQFAEEAGGTAATITSPIEDESTEWVFMVVPIVRLTPDSREALEPHFEWRRQHTLYRDKSLVPPDIHIDVEASNMAVFVTGVHGRGTVVTFTSEWFGLCKFDLESIQKNSDDSWKTNVIRREDSSGTGFSDLGAEQGVSVNRGYLARIRSWFTRSSAQRDKNARVTRNADAALMKEGMPKRGGHSMLPVADSDLDMFPKILKLLDTSYSHLRTGDAFTFVLKAILDFSEDYVKIVDAYEAAIEMLDKKLTLLKTKLSENDVRLIQRSARHLSKLRRTVRPLLAVVEVLSLQKDWGGESTLYISDIKSNINRFLSDSLALIETAEFLRANHLKYGEGRTGKVLYVLMLVTTVFTPAEFVATLYGMNFVNPSFPLEDRVLASPELNWKYGYLFFWGLVAVFVFMIGSLYRKRRWI